MKNLVFPVVIFLIFVSAGYAKKNVSLYVNQVLDNLRQNRSYLFKNFEKLDVDTYVRVIPEMNYIYAVKITDFSRINATGSCFLEDANDETSNFALEFIAPDMILSADASERHGFSPYLYNATMMGKISAELTANFAVNKASNDIFLRDVKLNLSPLSITKVESQFGKKSTLKDTTIKKFNEAKLIIEDYLENEIKYEFEEIKISHKF